MQKFFHFLTTVLPSETAYAHCDIPCGIYDPTPAKIAAQTVRRMVELIGKLPTEGNPSQVLQARNSFVRMVMVKEEHAQKCKTELFILWADYFKPQHLEQYPNLHDMFWKAVKLCSRNKQEVSMEAAEELIKAVDEIADVFYQTKQQK